MGPDSKSQRVRSVERALDILELLSEHTNGLTLSEIVSRLRLPKSTTHVLVRTLEARGYLHRPEGGSRFALATKLSRLAPGHTRSSGILNRARERLKSLAREFGETVHLAVLDGRETVYLHTEEGPQAMRMISLDGRRIPAHATAAGKAILATFDRAAVERFYEGAALERFTWRTIDSLEDLRRALDEVRTLGFAYDVDGFSQGLHCIAVPLRGEDGRAVASLSVSVPEARMDGERAALLIERLRETAAAIDDTPPRPLPDDRAGHRPAGAKPGLRVAWSMGHMDFQSYEQMYEAAHRAAHTLGVELIWTDAREHEAKQSGDVESLLALKPDVILIHPVHSLMSDDLFLKAEAAGIPAICFQRPSRSQRFSLFVGGDTYRHGFLGGRFVAEQLGGEGGIVIVGGDPYNDNALNIAQGNFDALRGFPGIEVLEYEPAPLWSPEHAARIAQQAIEKHGERVRAIIAANDKMAGAISEILIDLGLAGKVLLTGGDGDLHALKRIKAGTQTATLFQDPRRLAEEALAYAIRLAEGRLDLGAFSRRSIFWNPPGPKVYAADIPYTLISRDNLDILEAFWHQPAHEQAGAG